MSNRGVAYFSSRIGLLALCAALGLALGPARPAMAAVPAGGGGAFNELAGAAQGQNKTPTATAPTTTAPTTATTPTATTPTTTTGKTSSTRTASTETTSGSNSKTVILLVFGAAVVLLIGIGVYVMRDARRVAPVGDGPVGEGRSGHDPAARLRKRRAQSKAARQQRKRNR